MAERRGKTKDASKSKSVSERPPTHLPRATGGGGRSWTRGEGVPLASVGKLKQLFDADYIRWDGQTVSNEDFDAALAYWLCYPTWLEQVGYWWAQDEARYAAYGSLNRVHHRATEIIMAAAERSGIDSTPLMESAQWCRQLLADPTTYRAGGQGTWPACLEDSLEFLPPGAWEAAQRGYATLCRLSAKLEADAKTWPEMPPTPLQKIISQGVDGPWSQPDGPAQWAKKFNVSVSTIKRRFADGTIRNKKYSPKSYAVHIDDLPKSPNTPK